MPPCRHDRFHSGQGRYCHRAARLRYVVVCDACGAVVREISAVDYRPRFEPSGAAGAPGATAGPT